MGTLTRGQSACRARGRFAAENAATIPLIRRYAHFNRARMARPMIQSLSLSLRNVSSSLQGNESHHGEALRITPGRFERIVVVGAQCRWKHDDAIDARFIHQRKGSLDRERLGKLRPRVRRPQSEALMPALRITFPQRSESSRMY